jgi:hypothetical protein
LLGGHKFDGDRFGANLNQDRIQFGRVRVHAALEKLAKSRFDRMQLIGRKRLVTSNDRVCGIDYLPV